MIFSHEGQLKLGNKHQCVFPLSKGFAEHEECTDNFLKCKMFSLEKKLNSGMVKNQFISKKQLQNDTKHLQVWFSLHINASWLWKYYDFILFSLSATIFLSKEVHCFKTNQKFTWVTPGKDQGNYAISCLN